MPKSRALIATLLMIGGVEPNPGPPKEEPPTAYPRTVDEAYSKLKELLPDANQRGMVKGKLLDLSDEKVLRIFRDEDDAIKATLSTLAGSGSEEVTPAVKKELDALKLRMRTMEIQRNRRSQTTWAEKDVGELHYNAATIVREIGCLAPVTEKQLKAAVEEVSKKFPGAKAEGVVCRKPPKDRASSAAQKRRRVAGGEAADEDDDDDSTINPEFDLPAGLPGWSLSDLIPEAKEPGLSEEKHMQPRLVTILEAIGTVTNCKMQLVDTHSATKQFQNPIGRPDFSLLASPIIAWAQGVSFFEFKLWDTIAGTFHSFGQQTGRVSNTLSQQPDRTHWVTVGFTMNSVELAVFSRGDLDQLTVQRTTPKPFSIHHTSPGFKLVLRLLASTPAALGYQELRRPGIRTMSTKYTVEKLTQVHRGTAPQGGGSIVYEAVVPEMGKCILKLNQSQLETTLLLILKRKKVTRVVDILAARTINYMGATWYAILLHPYADPVTSEDGLELLAQVTFDVAMAIHGCIEAGVLHRDVTANNMGVHNGRGILFDFSAGKLLPPGTDPADLLPSPTGSVQQITGTPLYAPLSTLCGDPHTESSMLEGLFISVLDRCSDGKLVGRADMDFTDLPRATRARRGSLTGARLGELEHIPVALRSFVQSLHDLFYPMSSESRVLRTYCTNVTSSAVQDVCRRYNENLKDS
eukprot:TRINITY_DN7138_c1_g4_i1.p1 TRINITY_DN7138_c1_g4~~TRINITY_DN7138_c1_g4_i1.p1  ORF type:complete len:692 (-),score=78.26 TRINITY_DN7138_c1_g4_i1:155-2230(-)